MTQHTAEIWTAVIFASISFASICYGINKLIYAFDVWAYASRLLGQPIIQEETKKGKK